MKKTISIFLVFVMLFTLIFNVSSQGTDVDFDASGFESGIKTYYVSELTGKYKTQGRTSVIDDLLMLDHSASGIEFNAYCTGNVSISFEASDLIQGELGGIYFTVIIDGVVQDRSLCHISQTGKTTVTIAENLVSNTHNFKIYRQTEISNGTVGISSISFNGFFASISDNDLYIEFIGDSITTGYGNLTLGTELDDASQAAYPLYQDATKTFAYLTSEKLNADYSLVALSGIGASVGWTGSMQDMYVKLRYQKDSSTDYDFAKQPDIVVIGLGTNDYDTYENNSLTESDVIQGFKDMLSLAREKNPNAKIVWVYNMMRDWANTSIPQVIEEAGGSEAGYYSLQLTKDNSGGREHPYYTAHETMATELAAFINDNFYWNNKTVDFAEFIGNSIRTVTTKGEQGLRFKYQFNTDSSSEYTKLNEQFTVKQVGVLAIKDIYLNQEELFANTVYNNRKASCGVFYDQNSEKNYISDEGIASAVLYNIGYNKSSGTVDFSAYAADYTTRCYMILNNGVKDFYVYDDSYLGSVFEVMQEIVKDHNNTESPDSQLVSDYTAIQNILANNTLKDKNEKTINDLFTAYQTSAETYLANEITLTSSTEYDNPVYTVDTDVIFTNQDTGTTITVPAFWNGGTEWKVRYALTETGDWKFVTRCTDTKNLGLHYITGSVDCTEYSGDLEIYKRGFLKVEEGERWLSYADNTNFFYLGDTHWSLPMESLTNPKGNEYTNTTENYTYGALTDAEITALKEEYSALGYDTSELGTKPQFEYIMDYRAEQGFTVIQSQQLDIYGSGHKGNSWMAENAGNIFTYGVNDFILEKFQTLDKYYAYIAELGLVHANTQFSYPEELIKEYRHNTVTDTQLKKLCRYWVARYSAYPVIWATAQECDDKYGDYHNIDIKNNADGTEGSDGLVDGCTHSTVCQVDENLHNPWYDVMEYIAEYDPYNHPNTGHQRSVAEVAASGSLFDDSEHHDLYAAQLQGFKLDGDPWYGNKIFGITDEYWDYLKDYWNNGNSKPVVCYEGSYDQSACTSLRARGQGWLSFLNGIYGYGYGVLPLYNIYWGLGMGPYKDADEPNKNYYYNEDMNWVDGVYAEAAENMSVMKKFLTETLYNTYGVNWWELIPCFDDSSYYSTPYDTTSDGTFENCYSVSTVDKNSDGTVDMYIGYFAGEETIDMGVLNGMKTNSQYNYSWYDVGTGELVETYTVNTRSNTTRPVGYTNDTTDFWGQVPGEKPISDSTSQYTDMLLIVTPK